MKKTKKELMEEASKLASEHQEKKIVIEKILNDLDKEKISGKHVGGIAAVNDILKEMEDIEIKHAKLIEEIKAN